MPKAKGKRNAINVFRIIYTPKYIILNVAIAIIYYFIFVELVKYQNYGIFLIGQPIFLIYALVIASSIMFTIGIFSIRNTIKRKTNASASAVGTVATMLAGIVTGCGCSAPLLYSITALGLSISEISLVQYVITRYSTPIISVIIAINILLIVYYSRKVSRECRL